MLALPVLIITLCFTAGRLLLYYVIGIYSSFPEKTVETLLWCLLTGFVTACAMAWLNRYVDGGSRIKRSLILGGPAVWGWICFCSISLCRWFFPADIPDLILRTLTDTFCRDSGLPGTSESAEKGVY